MDAVLDIVYEGGISLSLEGRLSFDRTMSFDCKILSLCGKARLQFNRHPYTHWSFSFIQVCICILDEDSGLGSLGQA